MSWLKYITYVNKAQMILGTAMRVAPKIDELLRAADEARKQTAAKDPELALAALRRACVLLDEITADLKQIKL